nr:src-like-adapter 2 isoform X4 [Zootoca vivipara]
MVWLGVIWAAVGQFRMCAPPKSCLKPQGTVHIPGGTSLSLHGTSVLGSTNGVRFSSRWLYEGISRSKAEELLLLPSNTEGYFLIRESQMKKGCYSLSIRHTNRASWDCVKHYRINCMENGWLYISPGLTFSSLQELVEYYSEAADGLCCCLKEPCFIQGSTVWQKSNLSQPMVVKKPALNWEEISSSDLLAENPLSEDSPISLGLREAVTSYLLMTEELPSEDTISEK